MTVQEATIAKIREMPEALLEEVNDFVDFLMTRAGAALRPTPSQFAESLALAGSDLSDYLPNLQDYEECLARGEVRW